MLFYLFPFIPPPLNKSSTGPGTRFYSLLYMLPEQYLEHSRCSMDMSYTDRMNDSVATTGKRMHRASCASDTAFSLMKETKAEAPGKMEWFFPFQLDTVRISTVLSFRKPANENTAKVIENQWLLPVWQLSVQSCSSYNSLSRLRLQRGMDMKPFVHELHLARSNNLLTQAIQEGHVSSLCLFIPGLGWIENTNSTQMY